MRDINFICAVSSSNDDNDDGSPPEGRFIGFYVTWVWDESDGFSLPSLQTIMGE